MPSNQNFQGLSHYLKTIHGLTVSPAVYVTEDGLVGYQWEEQSLFLPMLEPPVWGNVRAGMGHGWGGGTPQ